MKFKSIFVLLGVAVCVVGAFAATSYAQTANITYPIAELGSCKDKQDCKTYCDQSANMPACVAFAEKQGLLKGDELRVSKIVAQKVSAGQTPGGCSSASQCEAYCNGSVEHLNACLSFGQELGTISKTDLEEAKKIASALEKGAAMPGSCKTKGECEKYCAVSDHIDECLNFAEASGIIPADELAQARKVAPFLKSGETPGKCSTKAECDAYCAVDTNFEACLGFAEKVGFVSKDDAAIARKTGGKGPGNCKSKEECAAYCNDSAHAAECVTFAKDKGLLTAEQQTLIDTGMDKLKAGLAQVPAEVRSQVVECLQNAVGGKDKLDRLMSKQDVPTQAIGDKIQGCFANISELMQKAMMDKYSKGAQSGGSSAGENRGPVPPTGDTNSAPPAGAGGPPSSVGGAGGPPSGGDMCAAFASAPSCDYVPAGQARDMCVKCKQ